MLSTPNTPAHQRAVEIASVLLTAATRAKFLLAGQEAEEPGNAHEGKPAITPEEIKAELGEENLLAVELMLAAAESKDSAKLRLAVDALQ